MNIRIYHGVNLAAVHAIHHYLVYLNDNMICAPQWNLALYRRLEYMPTNHCFMLFSTMVEPVKTGNPCVTIKDFDQDIAHCQAFTCCAQHLSHPDWFGATWPPTLIHRDWWHRVGGYSSEFSPGMISDNDLSMKMWQAGCHIFLGVGNSLVYHFQQKSTCKIAKNNERRQFLQKWGMTQSTLDRFYLQRGKTATHRPWVLFEPKKTTSFRWAQCKNRIKRLSTKIKAYGHA